MPIQGSGARRATKDNANGNANGLLPQFLPERQEYGDQMQAREAPAGAEKLPPVEAARPAHTGSSLRRDSASLRAWCRDRNEVTKPPT